MESKDKKSHILQIAQELFSHKGFDATTVRDIADKAAVNVAMISYYFGSKEGLMEFLFHERMDEARLKMETLIKDKSIPPFEKIEMMLKEYISKVMKNQSFYKILITEHLMSDNKKSVILKLLAALKLNYANLYTEIIKEGQRKKIFKKNVDVVMALNTMTGTVIHFVVNKQHYVTFNNIKNLDESFERKMEEKLFIHLREIFKTIVGYEE